MQGNRFLLPFGVVFKKQNSKAKHSLFFFILKIFARQKSWPWKITPKGNFRLQQHIYF
jgi:hypothetical protein